MSDIIELCQLGSLLDGVPKQFELRGEAVMALRLGDTVYVLADRCSHQDYPLSKGEVDAHELRIECPGHGSLFSLTTGDALTLPATKPVKVYETKVEGDKVMIKLDCQ
ncbi:MAG: non-heme iron oxygenase ferredoxin subunit [Actinobacteria bacterium]|nr:non-heme iron oxygenase ferredoxin subunit [Actinomycetota bacterium]MCL6105448.1 non-heme iron oxygenase ferredoxin subunit [Actinomycetota bacterium]